MKVIHTHQKVERGLAERVVTLENTIKNLQAEIKGMKNAGIDKEGGTEDPQTRVETRLAGYEEQPHTGEFVQP